MVHQTKGIQNRYTSLSICPYHSAKETNKQAQNGVKPQKKLAALPLGFGSWDMGVGIWEASCARRTARLSPAEERRAQRGQPGILTQRRGGAERARAPAARGLRFLYIDAFILKRGPLGSPPAPAHAPLTSLILDTVSLSVSQSLGQKPPSL